MKYFYKKLFLICLTIACAVNGFSQVEFDQTIVVSGGYYANANQHVAVAYHNAISDEYQVFDSIYTQSTQAVIVDGDFAFVCAQDSLVKYDLTSYQRVAAVEITALKNLAVYNDKLIVTRQYPITTEGIKILNKTNLDEIVTLETSGEASGIAIANDSAYIAIPGAWGTEEGKVAVVDMVNNTLVREINFGSDAKGLKEVFIENSTLYTVNTHFCDYTNNIFSVSEYNIYSGDITTHMFDGDYYGFYGNSVLAEGNLFIPVSMTVARYDIAADEMDLTFIDIVPASIKYENVNQKLHITTSDFEDYGELRFFNMTGEEVGDMVDVGVSPEAIALHYNYSSEFEFEDVVYWIGEGENEALFVIDWNDEVVPESMAWGFRWNGDITGEDMMQEIAADDSRLDINIAGGFLNDIIYTSSDVNHSGVAGSPDWWSTWSATATYNWEMNSGVSAVVNDGDWFGCSYGFTPAATAPNVPVATPIYNTGIDAIAKTFMKVYQQGDGLRIEADVCFNSIELFNVAGNMVVNMAVANSNSAVVPVNSLAKGVYIVRLISDNSVTTKKIFIN
ncbi:MAG: T9SS type A sorting domain-containing protein [Bacteroidota bacterium]|nr:T9SS type A sorting domain-containing protein [Bacteroidota bacterium]